MAWSVYKGRFVLFIFGNYRVNAHVLSTAAKRVVIAVKIVSPSVVYEVGAEFGDEA
jgi:hypothetical protein